MINVEELLAGPINRASFVYRYSSRPVHKQESVAEHSYQVALYSLMIAMNLPNPDEIKFDQMLTSAIIHDIDECVTGDFVRSFKYSDLTLKKKLDDAAEKFVIELLGPLTGDNTWVAWRWRKSKTSTIEGQIVRVADYLSVVSYLMRELKMGNRTFADVVVECRMYGLDTLNVITNEDLKLIVQKALELLTEETNNAFDFTNQHPRRSENIGHYLASIEDDRGSQHDGAAVPDEPAPDFD